MATSTPPTSLTDSTSALNPPSSNPTVTTGPTFLHIALNHKLTRDNFSSWNATVVPVLKGHSLFGFVDGTSIYPPPTVTTQSTTGTIISQHGLCRINLFLVQSPPA